MKQSTYEKKGREGKVEKGMEDGVRKVGGKRKKWMGEEITRKEGQGVEGVTEV